MPGIRAYAGYAERMGVHLLIVSIGYFLLTCAGLTDTKVHSLVAMQAVAGAAAISLQQAQFDGPWGGGIWTPTNQAWIAIDLFSSTLIVMGMAQRLHRASSLDGWLAFAASIIGLGLLVDCIVLTGNAQRSRSISASILPLLFCSVLAGDVPLTDAV